MKDLFNGIAVVIDDEVENQGTEIYKIINQIETENIPVLKYDSIPEDEKITHFQNLSFILLDWSLTPEEITQDATLHGVKMGGTLKNYNQQANINFILKLNEICFCPVFIFSNTDTSTIERTLLDNNLLKVDTPSNILIKSKSNLIEEGSLFRTINQWLKESPSIYVLKEWEKEYQSCKTKLFSEFYNINPAWATVMWENFKTDGVNPSLEMGELISRNLHSRMTPFEFNDKILNKTHKANTNELRQILEGERFLNKDCFDPNNVSLEAGDIFKENGNYYINIRASCDLIPRSSDETVDDIDLYLIKGKKISNPNIKKYFNEKYGKFNEQENIIIFPIDGGKAVDFKFKNLSIKKFREIKDKRKGRLLPPHITRIQQRYALYMQRQGLPRTPDKAIYDTSEQ